MHINQTPNRSSQLTNLFTRKNQITSIILFKVLKFIELNNYDPRNQKCILP